MAAYKGNVGMMEVLEITLHGTVEQQARLQVAVDNDDFEALSELAHEVLGYELYTD